MYRIYIFFVNERHKPRSFREKRAGFLFSPPGVVWADFWEMSVKACHIIFTLSQKQFCLIPLCRTMACSGRSLVEEKPSARQKSILNILWLHAKISRIQGTIKNRVYCRGAYPLARNITGKRKVMYEVDQIKNPNQYVVGRADRLSADRRDYSPAERQWN